MGEPTHVPTLQRPIRDGAALGYVDGLQGLPDRAEGLHPDSRFAYRAAWRDGEARRLANLESARKWRGETIEKGVAS